MNALIKRLSILLAIVGLILLIPLVAMRFSDEVVWDLFDFVVMGVLLFGTGLAIDCAVRRFRNSTHRIAIIIAIIFIFLLIWAELAVGVFGTPFAGS